MSRYIYPAIFKPEDNGAFSVMFPDVDGCFACGDDLQEAFEMSEDALALMLYHYEQKGTPINNPSNISDIKIQDDEFISFVPCDTIEYQIGADHSPAIPVKSGLLPCQTGDGFRVWCTAPDAEPSLCLT